MKITDKGRKPVVNAIFIADSVPKVKVFQSKYILDNSPFKIINDAQVTISLNGQSYSLYYNSYSQTYTNTNLILNSLMNVSLNIQSSFGEAEGETIIPVNVPILSSDTFPRFNNEGIYEGIEIRLRFKDIAGEHNYYMIVAYDYLNNSINFDNLNEPGIEIINNKMFIDDFSFDGKTKTVKLYANRTILDRNRNNGYINIYLLHLNEPLYKYMLSSNKQKLTGNSPFSEPVMVFNNIKNGYGICAATNISKITINL